MFNIFGLFKKKSELEKLTIKYQDLLEQSYKQSTVNRRLSDSLAAQADEVLKQIDLLDKNT